MYVTESNMSVILACPLVEKLYLSASTSITSEGLKHLSACKNLWHLDLADNANITGTCRHVNIFTGR